MRQTNSVGILRCLALLSGCLEKPRFITSLSPVSLENFGNPLGHMTAFGSWIPLSHVTMVRTKQTLKCLQCFLFFQNSFFLRAVLPSVNAKHN